MECWFQILIPEGCVYTTDEYQICFKQLLNNFSLIIFKIDSNMFIPSLNRVREFISNFKLNIENISVLHEGSLSSGREPGTSYILTIEL